MVGIVLNVIQIILNVIVIVLLLKIRKEDDSE